MPLVEVYNAKEHRDKLDHDSGLAYDEAIGTAAGWEKMIDDLDNCEDDDKRFELIEEFNESISGCYNFRILSDLHGEYIGCEIMTAVGGPNTWISTIDKKVNVYWWFSTASYPISDRLCEYIDDYVRELWGVCRE